MDNKNYYNIINHISSSSLKALLKSQLYFKQYWDGDVEQIDTKSTQFGTLVHMYLLEREKFNKEIEIIDYKIPNSPAKLKFCTCIHDGFTVLNAYKESYSTQEKDEKIQIKADKLKAECNDYLEYLRKSDFKRIISTEIFNSIVLLADRIKEHKLASKLIFRDEDELPVILSESDIYHFFEHAIYFKSKDLDCKALLDKIIVDKKAKKIIIVDLKTTWNLNEFKETYTKLKYDLQLAFYSIAITMNHKDLIGDDSIDDYSLELKIVVIDTSSKEVKVFNINKASLTTTFNLISNLLDRAKYHITNDKWEYSMEYYEGNGEEDLE